MSGFSRLWVQLTGRRISLSVGSWVVSSAALNSHLAPLRTLNNASCSTTDSLKVLIDDLLTAPVVSAASTAKKVRKEATRTDIRTAATISRLQKVCFELNKPWSSEIAALVLSQFSFVAFNTKADRSKVCEWMDRNIMNLAEQSLVGEASQSTVLTALTGLFSLGIVKGRLVEALLSSLHSNLSSNVSSVSVSLLLQFVAIVRTNGVTLPSDVESLLSDSVLLKASEIDNPVDAVSLLINVQLPNIYLEKVLQRTKELLPLMSVGQLVSLTSALAKTTGKRRDILPFVAAAFDSKSGSSISVNQLATLSLAMSALGFTDARMLRRLARDIVSNSSAFKKSSSVSAIICSFGKMRLSHRGAWNVLASWLNTNYKTVRKNDLSFMVTAFALCDECKLIEEPARYLGQVINVATASSPYAWLNIIYSLAVCNVLTPQLAETVLNKDFIKQFLKDDNLKTKFRFLSRIAQVQAYARYILGDKYHGPVMDLFSYLPPSQELNSVALEIRDGQKEAHEAESFHKMIYKIAPLQTHATAPTVNEDGVFVDTIIQLDGKGRCVAVKDMDTRKPRLAIIYLESRQLTTACGDDDESRPVGTMAFALRLLNAQEIIPVTFTEQELSARKMLAQKIEFIKKKLHAVAASEGYG